MGGGRKSFASSMQTLHVHYHVELSKSVWKKELHFGALWTMEHQKIDDIVKIRSRFLLLDYVTQRCQNEMTVHSQLTEITGRKAWDGSGCQTSTTAWEPKGSVLLIAPFQWNFSVQQSTEAHLLVCFTDDRPKRPHRFFTWRLGVQTNLLMQVI